MNYLLATIFSLFALSCFSQDFPVRDYPRDYFRDPLDIPISLAANFGELRANHYHMGLDIRTRQRVNLPVFAAADGYIAHVKIEPQGFGQAIYICHPNGYTTLYAHLNKFFPALAAYVSKQQYRLESWQVFLDIPPGLFPVKKGDFIAYSGSTGGSEGPHLHFEIRRTSDDTNLNPLLFGLPVPDSTDPVILRLAVYDRDRSIYEQAPRMITVHKVPRTMGAAAFAPDAGGLGGTPHEAGYSIGSEPVRVGSPKVSFALSAYDTQSGSANPNGIFQAILYKDEQPVIGFRMDNINYDHTRDINAHIDYKTREKGGPFLQHLSRLPGYTSPSIYTSFGKGPEADGVIDLSDGKLHSVRVEVKDADGNGSALNYEVQYQPALSPAVNPADIGKEFYPGMLDGSESGDCAFYIPEKGLYDAAHIPDTVATGGPVDAGPSLPGGVSAVHQIGYPWIPLQTAFLVRLRPNRELSGAVRDKVVMVRWAGDKKDVQRPEWKGAWASARWREFGNFQLVRDEEAPVIKPRFRDGANLGKSSRLIFTVKDNLGAIRACRAELDGKWVCFTNDKGLAYIYTFDEHCPAGKHVLKITTEDEAGNKTSKEYRFTR
jgi:murein DD-endopeptidase MepM/ murein hydrolase activator NlpD